MPRELKELDFDIAWIVALWLSIHGGDPIQGGGDPIPAIPAGIAVDEVTADLVQTLTSHLARTHPDLVQQSQSLDALETRMKKLGFEISRTPPTQLTTYLYKPLQPAPPPEGGSGQPSRFYCFTYQGRTICTLI